MHAAGAGGGVAAGGGESPHFGGALRRETRRPLRSRPSGPLPSWGLGARGPRPGRSGPPGSSLSRAARPKTRWLERTRTPPEDREGSPRPGKQAAPTRRRAMQRLAVQRLKDRPEHLEGMLALVVPTMPIYRSKSHLYVPLNCHSYTQIPLQMKRISV